MLTIYSAMIGYSRLVLKDHTLDQILLGLAFGAWMAFVFHIFVRDKFVPHVESLLSSERPKLVAPTLISFGLLALFVTIQMILLNFID